MQTKKWPSRGVGFFSLPMTEEFCTMRRSVAAALLFGAVEKAISPWEVGCRPLFFMPMSSLSKSKQLERLVEDVLEPSTFEVVLVEYKKSGSQWVLRIFIDHPDGVTLDHCETVTHMISEKLDETEPIQGSYHIEVSSPGVDRPLVKPRDFQRFVTQRVQVKVRRAVEGLKSFTGTLESCREGVIEVTHENDRKTYRIPLADIARATLKPILNFC